MVSVDKSIIARLDSRGEHFEVLVDPELALKVRRGEKVPVDKLLAVGEIFRDCKKGERASPEDISRVFDTNDLEAVANRIIKKGEIQLTTEQRRRMLE